MSKHNSRNIKVNIDVSNAYDRLNKSKTKAIIVIIITTIILAMLDLLIGNSNCSIFELITQAITNPASTQGLIIWNLRLPHVATALIVGGVLGISGCLLQSSLGNPLASSSTIGISQGAAFGACIAIVAFSGALINYKFVVILFAFCASLIPTLIIYCLSKYKKLSSTSIILCGIALTIFFGGAIAFVEYFVDSSKLGEIVFWTFGSVQDKGLIDILIMLICLSVIFVFAQLSYIKLNALECGDFTTHNIGINPTKTRLLNMIVCALCCGAITAICGTINFIGLLAPHIMRKFCGSNYKYLIVASAFCGSSILLLSDILSMIIIPGAILPIGVITSIIGAPIFIFILIRKIK